MKFNPMKLVYCSLWRLLQAKPKLNNNQIALQKIAFRFKFPSLLIFKSLRLSSPILPRVFVRIYHFDTLNPSKIASMHYYRSRPSSESGQTKTLQIWNAMLRWSWMNWNKRNIFPTLCIMIAGLKYKQK